jgi:hypothetical protein
MVNGSGGLTQVTSPAASPGSSVGSKQGNVLLHVVHLHRFMCASKHLGADSCTALDWPRFAREMCGAGQHVRAL